MSDNQYTNAQYTAHKGPADGRLYVLDVSMAHKATPNPDDTSQPSLDADGEIIFTVVDASRPVPDFDELGVELEPGTYREISDRANALNARQEKMGNLVHIFFPHPVQEERAA